MVIHVYKATTLNCFKKIFFGEIICSTHQKKCLSTILGNFWKIELWGGGGGGGGAPIFSYIYTYGLDHFFVQNFEIQEIQYFFFLGGGGGGGGSEK